MNNQDVLAKHVQIVHAQCSELLKGWGLSAKLGKHSVIWGKLGTALQAYTLNPCTEFPPVPLLEKSTLKS